MFQFVAFVPLTTGTRSERGCAESQPQRVAVSTREEQSTNSCQATLLRLILRTQPRSEGRIKFFLARGPGGRLR